MNKTIHIKITVHRPRAPLQSSVIAAVCAAQVRERKNDRRIFGTLIFVSSVLFVPAVAMTVRAFAASNFGSYFSLAFSDIGSVGMYWKELGLSLIESLPIVSIALSLSLIALAMWGVRKMYRISNSTFVKFA